MTNQPLISIIIPCYNRSGIIATCLESLRLQTYQHFEVIIVDDASDDSEQLCQQTKSFTTLSIHIIRHKKNLHGAAARNTGINAASGQYIALLDSDDSWRKDKLELSLLQCQHANDVVYSQLKNELGTFPQRAKLPDEPVGDYLIVHGGSMQTSTLFMHTAFAKAVLFNPELKRFQDYDFALRLEAQGANFMFIDEVLTYMHDDLSNNRISEQTDPTPALFWLAKSTGLTLAAQKAFYLKRVARLLIKSGNQHQIFSAMPEPISNVLSIKEKAYCLLLYLLPQSAYMLMKKVKKLLK